MALTQKLVGLDKDVLENRWQRTARGRLRFELGGLAFAMKVGYTSEGYAQHLWSSGAVEWMGKAAPIAKEYLLKEMQAFGVLYPEVAFELGEASSQEAELTFVRGCLGGWGQDQWSVARRLGLGKGHVCRYCRHAFRVWGSQLGLQVCPEPKIDGTCVLLVRKLQAG